jgi:hypothetical protein
MRLLAAIAVFPFFVAPALAQSTDLNQQQSRPNAADTQSIQTQVRDNLQQAGFTDIKIMPSSFLVQAKDRAGNPVMMVINPDSVTAVTEMGAGSQQGGAANGGANGPNAQNSGAGAGADVDRYSFIVVDLHHLLPISRRTSSLTCPASQSVSNAY